MSYRGRPSDIELQEMLRAGATQIAFMDRRLAGHRKMLRSFLGNKTNRVSDTVRQLPGASVAPFLMVIICPRDQQKLTAAVSRTFAELEEAEEFLQINVQAFDDVIFTSRLAEPDRNVFYARLERHRDGASCLH
jgi:hypothetical protein